MKKKQSKKTMTPAPSSFDKPQEKLTEKFSILQEEETAAGAGAAADKNSDLSEKVNQIIDGGLSKIITSVADIGCMVTKKPLLTEDEKKLFEDPCADIQKVHLPEKINGLINNLSPFIVLIVVMLVVIMSRLPKADAKEKTDLPAETSQVGGQEKTPPAT